MAGTPASASEAVIPRDESGVKRNKKDNTKPTVHPERATELEPPLKTRFFGGRCDAPERRGGGLTTPDVGAIHWCSPEVCGFRVCDL